MKRLQLKSSLPIASVRKSAGRGMQGGSWETAAPCEEPISVPPCCGCWGFWDWECEEGSACSSDVPSMHTDEEKQGSRILREDEATMAAAASGVKGMDLVLEGPGAVTMEPGMMGGIPGRSGGPWTSPSASPALRLRSSDVDGSLESRVSF